MQPVPSGHPSIDGHRFALFRGSMVTTLRCIQRDQRCTSLFADGSPVKFLLDSNGLSATSNPTAECDCKASGHSSSTRKHQETCFCMILDQTFKTLGQILATLRSSHPILSHLQIYSQITSTDPVSSQAGGYGTSFASEANASTCDDAESQSGAVDFYINLFPLLLMLLK